MTLAASLCGSMYSATKTPSFLSHRFSQTGVTIVELMVVVAIVSLATAFAVPNYITWNTRNQLKQAITELHSNLNLTRMSAMNRNTTMTVQVAAGVVDPSDGRPKVTATFTDLNGATIIQPQRMNPVITGLAGTAQVRFDSRGLRVGGGAGAQTITLTNSRNLSYEVQVTAAGKIRWCYISPCP
jgi:prepilin-type N-terminal cleavage/methylation domain-containing protein